MNNETGSQKMTEKGTPDWHRAQIIAALHMAGISMSALSVKNGLNKRTLGNALDRRWPKGQNIIAAAIGIAPEVIWPSRY